jgi:hypothetical protein
VQDGEHEPEVARNGGLAGKHLLDPTLDPVIAAVDLVVEGDYLVAELRILADERVDGSADRPEDILALFLQVRLELLEILFECYAHRRSVIRTGR